MWRRGQKSSSGRSSSGKSTEASSSFLDRSQHRCSSIESLLSLEQPPLVAHDDENDLKVIPLESSVPMEVDIQKDGHTILVEEVNNTHRADDDVCDESNGHSEIDTNIGLDISETNGVSESEEGKTGINNDSCVGYRPFAAIHPTIDSVPNQSSVEGEKEKSLKPIRSILSNTTIIPAIDDDPSGGFRKNKKLLRKNASIRFGAVEVHEHEAEIGRSSVPLRGPPIGLGWKRASYRNFPSVDDHHDEAHLTTGGPRPHYLLHQSSEQRVDKYVMTKGFIVICV